MIAQPRSWIIRASGWLTPRRIRAHAIILALCLWGVCVVDYSTPGLFDRAGNIKFQDFLQFPISARLIAENRAIELYDDQVLATGIRAVAGQTNVHLQYFYGPQVAVPFIPLVRLPFLVQASIWAAVSLLIYFGCVYLIWKHCAALHTFGGTVAICALAFPPVFHFFVRGQLSPIVLACFVAAYLAFASRREFVAGIALGFLVFKPQLLVAVPLVLLLGKAWWAFAGVSLSAAIQLGVTFLYFGPDVMRRYMTMLLRSASQPRTTELALSPIQMHSLHSFWELLLPWPAAVWPFYLLTSVTAMVLAAAIWKSSLPLALRFSGLLLAAVLANPHIYIYDLLAMVPVFLLLANWSLEQSLHPSVPALRVLLYLAFILPLFGPLARWTHLQLSVVVFAVLLWIIYRIATPSYKLALRESSVV